MTAILRTLLITLGLLLLSPWQVADARTGSGDRAVQPICAAATCRSDETRLRLGDVGRSGPAAVMPSAETSSDDSCAPARPAEAPPGLRVATTRAQTSRPVLGRMVPDGPERPPKAGSRLPT